MTPPATPARTPTIGIDVGGTFTDFVALLPDGRMLVHKQPSTPGDPSEALQLGLAALLAREGLLRDEPVRLVHGTTIALNAVLQRKVAKIGLVVSAGNRDVIEIARIRTGTTYNLRAGKERPLVPRDLVFETSARMAADGSVLARPDDAEIDAICGHLQAAEVDAVAIMLLNAYVDPALEDALAAAISARLPALLVTRSAAIWPEMREYERAVVACLNAQIHPLMRDYLERLERRVRDAGCARATIQLTSSSGGMLSVPSTARRPIDTMLSGPASGATAAARICEAAGIDRAISFDMGGTSADIAVIDGGEVQFTTKARIGELPLMMPVVGVSSIGAGGGSIVSVDSYGVIKVGPESAGAHPGPVAYGLGATRPTVTDCYVVLGFIDPDHFLGGSMKLDAARAVAALARIAEKLKLPSPEHAAEAALAVATTGMASELFKLMAQRGEEPAGYCIVPFGGAGPTHAAMLADELGMRRIAIPPAAATFCALGAAMADVRREFVRGLGHGRVADLAAVLWENWERMEAEAEAWLDGENIRLLGRRRVHALDMRYTGQSFSITTIIPEEACRTRSVAALFAAFHRAHGDIYGFHEDDGAVEAVTQRLSMIGEVPKLTLPELAAGATEPAARARRRVFHRGAWLDAGVHRGEDFGAGSRVAGPAIVEQDDTCVWVPPEWEMLAGGSGVLSVNRIARDAA